MRRRQQDDVKVSFEIAPDGNFPEWVRVQLPAGQTVHATQPPIVLGEGVTASPTQRGFGWRAEKATTLLFGTGGVAQVVSVAVDGASLVVADSLVYLWTGEVSFAPCTDPALERFANVTGEGELWLRVPGFGFGYPNPRLPDPLMVDTRHVVHATAGSEPLSVVPGPDGRPMLRLGGSSKALLHAWPARPG
jgi:hypothetical protein